MLNSKRRKWKLTSCLLCRLNYTKIIRKWNKQLIHFHWSESEDDYEFSRACYPRHWSEWWKNLHIKIENFHHFTNEDRHRHCSSYPQCNSYAVWWCSMFLLLHNSTLHQNQYKNERKFWTKHPSQLLLTWKRRKTQQQKLWKVKSDEKRFSSIYINMCSLISMSRAEKWTVAEWEFGWNFRKLMGKTQSMY